MCIPIVLLVCRCPFMLEQAEHLFGLCLSLEEHRSQLVEAASPGEEFVGRALGYVAYGVEAGCLKVGCRLAYLIRTLLASATNEYAKRKWFLLLCPVLEILR